jgi:hypothetical protein
MKTEFKFIVQKDGTAKGYYTVCNVVSEHMINDATAIAPSGPISFAICNLVQTNITGLKHIFGFKAIEQDKTLHNNIRDIFTKMQNASLESMVSPQWFKDFETIVREFHVNYTKFAGKTILPIEANFDLIYRIFEYMYKEIEKLYEDK